MRLYIEGHNHRLGYAISRELTGTPPVRYRTNLRRARRLVDRYNRRFGALPANAEYFETLNATRLRLFLGA